MSKSDKNALSDFEERLIDLNSMSKKELIQRAEKFSKPYRIGNGSDFKLKDYETKAMKESLWSIKPCKLALML
jgi:hypothetical protein